MSDVKLRSTTRVRATRSHGMQRRGFYGIRLLGDLDIGVLIGRVWKQTWCY